MMMILTLCTMLLTLVTTESQKTQKSSNQKQENTDEETNVFHGKSFTWSRTPPKVARACRENIIVHLPGCVDEAKNANTPHDFFFHFLF